MAGEPTWNSERFMAYVFDHAEAVLGYRPNATELAAAAGISHPAVSRWKSGHSMPSTDHLRSLADAFSMDLAALYVVVGLLPDSGKPLPAAPPPMHPLASRLNRMLVEATSQLSGQDRAELEVVLRRVMLAFGVTVSKR